MLTVRGQTAEVMNESWNNIALIKGGQNSPINKGWKPCKLSMVFTPDCSQLSFTIEKQNKMLTWQNPLVLNVTVQKKNRQMRVLVQKLDDINKHIFRSLFSNSLCKCGCLWPTNILIYSPWLPELLPLLFQITVHLQTTSNWRCIWPCLTSNWRKSHLSILQRF